MRKTSIANALFVLCLLWASSAASQTVPPLLPVQGYLTNSSGVALADGSYTIVFRIYDAPTVGVQRFTETVDVDVAGGFFTVYLGDTVPLDPVLFKTYPDLYLALKVGADPESTPRIQLATAAFSGVAQYCADSTKVGGKTYADLMSTFLASEADPQVGTLTNNMWCTSNGTAVNCATAAPVLAEADPKIGTQTAGNWCTSNGTTVNCATAAPVLVEADPQVGTLTNGLWCTSNGTAVNCASAAPVLAEADPQVGTMSNGSWCTSDGSSVNCGAAAPLLNVADSVALSNMANNSVGSAEITDNSIAYTDTNVDSVQRRVTGTCSAGSAINAINNTGTVGCTLGPLVGTVETSMVTAAGGVSIWGGQAVPAGPARQCKLTCDCRINGAPHTGNAYMYLSARATTDTGFGTLYGTGSIVYFVDGTGGVAYMGASRSYAVSTIANSATEFACRILTSGDTQGDTATCTQTWVCP